MSPPGGSAGRWDLSGCFEALAADLCRRLPELTHIDPKRVLFALARSRAGGMHGTYARIAPLRFAAGEPEITRRRGRFTETFRMPSLRHEGREILYLIHLMVPRFLRLAPEQKLNTLIHELYHISERCDGDIRRFPGRNFAHGTSREAYNRRIAILAADYLGASPPRHLMDVLHLSESQWKKGEILVTGISVPLPRPHLVARRRI